MPLDSSALIDAVASVLQRSGYFEKVNQHEVKSVQGPGLTASVWYFSITPSQRKSTLNTTAVRVAFTCRIYMSMTQEPLDEIEPAVVEAADWVMNTFTGEFTLDGISDDCVELDLLGSDGVPLGSNTGYVNIGGALQRVLDITVPLVIYDVWEQIR